MSLVYSDTANLKGILQLIEKELEFEYGYITGNATRLKKWTAEVNLTHDEVLAKIFTLGGKWNFDDTNHTKYPEIECDLVSGQRDYTFTTDEQGNVILDIHRVLVKNPDGTYVDINPVDKQSGGVNKNVDTSRFIDGKNLTGTPTAYDKTANGIIFDLIPNYSWRQAQEGSKGVKILINREGSYFTTSDSTKKPGIDGRLHEIYAVNPAYKYALRKGTANLSGLSKRRQELIGDDTLGIKGLLHEVYGKRERDVIGRLTPLFEDNR